MIIQRNILRYHTGKLEEAISLLKDETASLFEKSPIEMPRSIRHLIPTDSKNTSVSEYEWEDMTQMEHFWNSWRASSSAELFLSKYRPLIDGEMVTEILQVA